MKRVNFCFQKAMQRRTFLRGAGVSMALPWLSAMNGALAASTDDAPPRRFVSFSLGLGLIGENLNPKDSGRDYKASRYLKSLEDIRNEFTVISGTSHPGVKGGHRAEASILSATAVGTSGQASNGISLDQYLAKHLGDATRYPSLVLSNGGSTGPSYTENGAMIPPLGSPSELFARLFVNESKRERELQAKRIREGRSIMDLVGEDAKSLARELGTADRDRLGQYFSSVRDLEKRMAANESWAKRRKPKVDAKQPVDIGSKGELIGRQKMMSSVMKLALETDSTRFITFHIPDPGGSLQNIEGVSSGYHSLSHHGRDEDKLVQLALVETQIINAWADFLRDLQGVGESNGTLLDNTSVILTSNLGNASNHDNRNMPVLFGGGGFKHGQHLAFDQKKNYPLPNLFVSILQRHGLPVDKFVSSTGTMTGLEMV